jgi:protein phosphatase
MGGARAGEIAARLAAASLEEWSGRARGEEAVVALIVEANRRIWEHAVADPAKSGMGTTVTAALVDVSEEVVAIGHVGDSRAYRLRDDVLEQLTTDHSLVAELVRSGVLTPEEAERHPQRSAITRALGTEPTVEVEAFTVAAAPGDLFLICSDGLPTMVTDDVIADAIRSAGGDPAAAAEALVAAANTRGGEDNITVVLFELAEGEAASETEEPAPTDREVEATAETDHEDQTDPSSVESATAGVSRHGAGAGGRLAALALVTAVVLIGALALYWGLTR